MKKLLTVIAAISLTACAHDPFALSMSSPETLMTHKNYDLCIGYYFTKDDEIKAELERRNVFTYREWELIKANKISQGMNELALACSWGRSRENRSVGSWGVHIQHVFSSGRYTSYVYVRNGKVTSWQN